MTPGSGPRDETPNDSDGSSADSVESDHAGHYECQDDEGCTALPVTVSPCERHRGGPCYQ
jgi:hypothetical protein